MPIYKYSVNVRRTSRVCWDAYDLVSTQRI